MACVVLRIWILVGKGLSSGIHLRYCNLLIVISLRIRESTEDDSRSDFWAIHCSQRRDGREMGEVPRMVRSMSSRWWLSYTYFHRSGRSDSNEEHHLRWGMPISMSLDGEGSTCLSPYLPSFAIIDGWVIQLEAAADSSDMPTSLDEEGLTCLSPNLPSFAMVNRWVVQLEAAADSSDTVSDISDGSSSKHP